MVMTQPHAGKKRQRNISTRRQGGHLRLSPDQPEERRRPSNRPDLRF